MYYNVLHLLIVIKSDFAASIYATHTAPFMAKNRTIIGAVSMHRSIGIHLIIYIREKEDDN